MPLDNSPFQIDCDSISQQIEQFISDMVKKSGTKGIVIALSGGIDSSVAAALAVRALGKDKVLGLILPSAISPSSSEQDARKLAEQLGIQVKKIPITELMTAFSASVDQEITNDRVAFGNAMARFRMIILYAYSNHLNYLVIGTSNKSEILVGYITKYGDGGVDFEPCGGLYKTQIRLLANYLAIPEEIIKKPPSAELWEGQTDEGEMGISYELLDLVLLGFEKDLSTNQISEELNIDLSLVEKVQKMVKQSAHKRSMPPILEID
ncbi:MAG: NAD+ synthase [Candidatus Heimdallarchaeota archaeon]|nr:NAD+ synthase [Candidatus Heimdallarchaeota archaeon]